MRVLVCGGRDEHHADLIESTLSHLNATRGPFECLIDGEARGVDRMAGKWARDHGVLEWGYLPEWHRAGPEGEARNQLMIAETRPDLVVAFPGRCFTWPAGRSSSCLGGGCPADHHQRVSCASRPSEP